MAYEWDWPGAELEFKRSMGLKASSGVAHFRYAEYLVSMGRLDEGLAESKHVQEIDPLSPRMAGGLAYRRSETPFALPLVTRYTALTI
jgi:hypothetical protein